MARLSRGERVALGGGVVALVAALVLSAALFAEWLERPNPGFLIGFGPAGFEEAAEGSGYTLSYVVPFGPAAEAGLPADARVTAIEGVDVRDGKAIEELEQRLEVGQRINVRYVDGQGRERTIAVELTREPLEPFVLMRIGASLLLAISMLVIGFTVFLKAPHDRRARVLLGFTLVYGIWFLLYDPLGAFGSPSGLPDPGLLARLLFFLSALGGLSTALLLHLAVVFPKRRPFLVEHPAAVGWIYAPATAVIPICSSLALLFVGPGIELMQKRTETAEATGARFMRDLIAFMSDNPALAVLSTALLAALSATLAWRVLRALRERRLAGLLDRPWSATYAVASAAAALFFLLVSMRALLDVSLGRGAGVVVASLLLLPFLVYALHFVVQLIGALVFVVLSYREADSEEKRQVRWPLWGVGTYVVAAVLLTVFSAFFSGMGVTDIALFLDIPSKLATLLIPLSFAFAILRYRLMEIDVVIKKSLVYSLVMGLSLVVYVALAVGLGGALAERLELPANTRLLAAAVVTVGLFFPLRAGVQHVLERRLFPERQDYPAALGAFRAELGATRAEELPRLLAERLQAAMPTRAAVVWMATRAGGALRPEAHVGEGRPERLRPILLEDAPALAELDETPRRVDELGLDESLVEAFREMRIERVAGLCARGRLEGLLGFGRKVSRTEFDGLDRDFVRDLAASAARRLGDAALAQTDEQLARARAIQESLLPRRLDTPEGVGLAARYRPTFSVGGDYYDCVRVDDARVALCVADVSGKGIPAALLMSNCQAAYRSLAGLDLEPSRLVGQLNRVIAGNVGEGRFIALSHVALDARDGRVLCCNAGNAPPIVLRAAGGHEELKEGGLPLGLFEDAVYELCETTLEPGDWLVLFTDGLTEAESAEGVQLGERDLPACLREALEAATSAEEGAARIAALVEEHVAGELNDDLTLLVLRYERGAEPSGPPGGRREERGASSPEP